ncbi:hypothetical protein Btru_044016 [Bulinus truncatus]|nr:hypothetical protein Btru_044016 [Bulinus truncatus]
MLRDNVLEIILGRYLHDGRLTKGRCDAWRERDGSRSVQAQPKHYLPSPRKMAVVDPFTIYAVTAGTLLLIICIVSLISRFSSASAKEVPGRAQAGAIQPPANERRGPVRVRRRIHRPNRVADDDDSNEDEDEDIPEIAQPEGKIGAKKMKKLQEKAERKTMREFCLGNTALFTVTALIGYYISDLALLYLISFGGRINDLRTRFLKDNSSVQIVEEEEFIPQVDPDIAAALAKAINDSEDEGATLQYLHQDFPRILLLVPVKMMPSFDDLDNTDDELGLNDGNDNNGTHSRRALHFTSSHFQESDLEDDESLNSSDSRIIPVNTKASSGSHFELASTLARTISSMIESAMVGVSSLDEGKTASSSSLNPRTGSKITYTRTEKGESIDFLNPEPSISESDEDMENDESEHIAEIENDFDFLSELDPEHDND